MTYFPSEFLNLLLCVFNNRENENEIEIPGPIGNKQARNKDRQKKSIDLILLYQVLFLSHISFLFLFFFFSSLYKKKNFSSRKNISLNYLRGMFLNNMLLRQI